MFQDSGDRSLKTQAKFMVRSRAWITDPQRLTGGTDSEVRARVRHSLRQNL